MGEDPLQIGAPPGIKRGAPAKRTATALWGMGTFPKVRSVPGFASEHYPVHPQHEEQLVDDNRLHLRRGAAPWERAHHHALAHR